MEGRRIVRLHVGLDLIAATIWILGFTAEETAAGLIVTLLAAVALLWLVPWLVIVTRPWAGARLPGLESGQRLYLTASSVFLTLTWIAALATLSMYSSGLFIFLRGR